MFLAVNQMNIDGSLIAKFVTLQMYDYKVVRTTLYSSLGRWNCI